MGKKKNPSAEIKANNLADIANESDPTLRNGLAEAMGYGSYNAFNFPQNQGFPGTEQVSNANTLFKNLRWYLVSNFRQLLSELYVEIGLVQTIVDVPVDDALRGGIEIKSKQLSEEQIEDLQISLDRDNDLMIAAQAAKWNRLFGGAGILIWVSDQDPAEELNVEAIGPNTELEFKAVDMWELFWSEQNIKDGDPAMQLENFEYYNYYGMKLHKSRVMRLKGLEAPSFIRPRLRGWGFSVVEALVRSINQYLKATDLGFEVLDEFKLDVYKIKNLVNTLMSPGGDAKVKNRVQMANWQKNYQNAIVMDSEDDFDHKQLSFAGLAEAMDGIRMQVAADMRMPRSKLFGEGGQGLNSGKNEGDLEVYNSMVESQVRNKIKYDLLRLCEIKCQKLFQFIPDDLAIDFKPLRVLSGEQEENVKTQKFNRAIQAKAAGELTTQEFRDICNKGGLFDISLDTSPDMLSMVDAQVDEMKEDEGNKDNPDESKDTDDSGATKDSVENVLVTPKPYTALERIERILKNSAAFDRASYEADGGDSWIDVRRAPIFENPLNVDKALWAKAKAASVDAYGKDKWQFVVWAYQKLGGKF